MTDGHLRTWTCSRCNTVHETEKCVPQFTEEFEFLCAKCADIGTVHVSFDGDGGDNSLTRIGDAALAAIEAHEEYSDNQRVLVLITEPDDVSSTECVGLSALNYDDTRVVLKDIISHMRAAFEAHGYQIKLIPLSPDARQN